MRQQRRLSVHSSMVRLSVKARGGRWQGHGGSRDGLVDGAEVLAALEGCLLDGVGG